MSKKNTPDTSAEHGTGGVSSAEIARLRGKIDAGNVGSRGLATYLSSPCQRARALVAVGAHPRSAAKVTHGIEIPSEPSRIAAQVGQIFERSLVTRDAERLVELYTEHKNDVVRTREDTVVLDCETADIDPVERLLLEEPAETDGHSVDDAQSFMVKLQGLHKNTMTQIEKALEILHQQNCDVILLQPTFPFSLNGFTHYVRPDLIVCTDGEWRIGEIKVYLDREGETSGIEVASAVRQAAVGVLAAREALAPYNMSVSSSVDLIFRRHTRLLASVTNLSAEAELVTLEAGLRDANQVVAEWKTRVVSLDSAEALEQIPNFYTPSCEMSCPYNTACREVKEKSEGRVFHSHPGVATAEALGITGERAVQLASGAKPQSEQERQSAKWLSAGWGAARE